MTTKRKLITAVASLGILVILAGVALGVALAALTGNVNSGFSIHYSASSNVNAVIMGMYGVNGEMNMLTSDGESKIVFRSSDENGNKRFDDIEEIQLSAQNQEMYFQFLFYNFDKNEKELPLSITFDGEMKNLKVEYTIEDICTDETNKQTGVAANLPFSTTANIPSVGNGFGSYDEAVDYLASYLGSTSFTTQTFLLAAMWDAGVTYADGYEAMSEAADVFYEKSGKEVGDEYYGMYWYVNKICVLAPMFVLQKYLDTRDLSVAMETAEEIADYEYDNINALYPEEYVTAVRDLIYVFALTGVNQLLAYESLLAGEYVSGYQNIKYILSDAIGMRDIPGDIFLEGSHPIEHLAQEIIFYNIYNTFLNEGCDSAIEMVEELYHETPFYFCPIWPVEQQWVGYPQCEEAYEEFKSRLQEYNDQGSEGRITVQNKMEEIRLKAKSMEEKIRSGVNEMKLSQYTPENPLIALNLMEMALPSTNVMVRISIDDINEEAYWHNGSFNFVLG